MPAVLAGDVAGGWVDGDDHGVSEDLGAQLGGHGGGFGVAQGLGGFVLRQSGGEHGLGVEHAVVVGDEGERGVGVAFADFAG